MTDRIKSKHRKTIKQKNVFLETINKQKDGFTNPYLITYLRLIYLLNFVLS